MLRCLKKFEVKYVRLYDVFFTHGMVLRPALFRYKNRLIQTCNYSYNILFYVRFLLTATPRSLYKSSRLMIVVVSISAAVVVSVDDTEQIARPGIEQYPYSLTTISP